MVAMFSGWWWLGNGIAGNPPVRPVSLSNHWQFSFSSSFPSSSYTCFSFLLFLFDFIANVPHHLKDGCSDLLVTTRSPPLRVGLFTLQPAQPTFRTESLDQLCYSFALCHLTSHHHQSGFRADKKFGKYVEGRLRNREERAKELGRCGRRREGIAIFLTFWAPPVQRREERGNANSAILPPTFPC